MKKILLIFGTRPEVIKMAPVITELKTNYKYFETIICNTGQHEQMTDELIDLFKIHVDYNLKLMVDNQTLTSLTAKLFDKLGALIEQVKPDWILAQGDTTTVMVSSMLAYYNGIKFGHVEAGLRTDDLLQPFPEEANRRIADMLSTLCFAPTATSAEILSDEKIAKQKIIITGNTVVDTLLKFENQIDNKISQKILDSGFSKIVLITAHRRENIGKPIDNICLAIKYLAKSNPNVAFVYPVHLNPNINNPVRSKLSNIKNVKLLPPLDYFSLMGLIKNCTFVLTDSGGIQEEAPTWSKPVLVMRNETERPEGIAAGISKLVGTQTDIIIKEADKLLKNHKYYKLTANSTNPYGDGNAAPKIVEALKGYDK